jgi:cysteinyl-tRNA synthetase
MDDDLNTPRALAALFDLAREINRAQDTRRSAGQAQDCLRHLGGILGLTFQGQGPREEDQLAAKPFIDLLLETRAQLRQAKQYELADRIRQGLDAQGVSVEDTPQGSHWQYRPRQ